MYQQGCQKLTNELDIVTILTALRDLKALMKSKTDKEDWSLVKLNKDYVINREQSFSDEESRSLPKLSKGIFQKPSNEDEGYVQKVVERYENRDLTKTKANLLQHVMTDDLEISKNEDSVARASFENVNRVNTEEVFLNI